MEIEFHNRKVRNLCEDTKTAVRELGSSGAKKLHARLADLQAAHDVSELSAGRPHPLKGERQGQLAIELPDGKRLILVPANDPTPRRDDGGIDWSGVTKVCIIEVRDYHD